MSFSASYSCQVINVDIGIYLNIWDDAIAPLTGSLLSFIAIDTMFCKLLRRNKPYFFGGMIKQQITNMLQQTVSFYLNFFFFFLRCLQLICCNTGQLAMIKRDDL